MTRHLVCARSISRGIIRVIGEAEDMRRAMWLWFSSKFHGHADAEGLVGTYDDDDYPFGSPDPGDLQLDRILEGKALARRAKEIFGCRTRRLKRSSRP